MEINDYKRFFNLTAVCAADVNDGSSTKMYSFPENGKEIVAFVLDEDTDCYEKPLFFDVAQ